MPEQRHAPASAIVEALQVLGIRRLLLGIHDAAFPSAPAEDIGRGSPYGQGARELFDFARSLGFNGVQLGPQGMTSQDNASPYDSTLFSRNHLSLALLPLCSEDQGALLPLETLEALVAGRPQGSDLPRGPCPCLAGTGPCLSAGLEKLHRPAGARAIERA